MRTKRVVFRNAEGLELGGRLELPSAGAPFEFAIFAHCFTCGKESRAATDISRGLARAGFGVLRFDFTGIGESEGEFGETDFAGNLSDLKAAAAFLEAEEKAPALLIGHSLGGTAVLHVAGEIDSVRAVCTIGSPMEASHVLELLGERRDEIMAKGGAKVEIGGRPFCVGAGFLRSLEEHSTAELLPKLGKPLLILHSPVDEIVAVDQAAGIFEAAVHPKSFVSLDGADHLLSARADSVYAAGLIAAWAERYRAGLEPVSGDADEVVVRIGKRGFTSVVVAGRHAFLTDEPGKLGGADLGPSPYQLLSAALGGCTVMTLRMYADRKNWPLDGVTAYVRHEQRMVETGEEGLKRKRVDVFERILEIDGELDEEQRIRLVGIANRCPVHRTLADGEIRVETELR